MRIVAGSFPKGSYAIRGGFLSQTLSSQIAINSTTVESVEHVTTSQKVDKVRSYMRKAEGTHTGLVIAGGLGGITGGNTPDVTKEEVRFTIHFRSGKTAHCTGTGEEFSRVTDIALRAPGEKAPSPSNRTGLAPSLSDRDRLRAELQAEKTAAAEKKAAEDQARKAASAQAQAERAAAREQRRAEKAAEKERRAAAKRS